MKIILVAAAFTASLVSLAATADAQPTDPAQAAEPAPTAEAAPVAAPPARARVSAPVEPEPKDPPEAAPSRDRLGPAVFPFKYGKLRFGGVAQLTSEMQSDEEGIDGFADFRRLRIDTRVSFLDDALSLRTHISTMPKDPELLDLHVDAQLHPLVHLRAGVEKTPFTAYRQQSINDSVLVDWPIVSRWFGGERQLGFMLDGKPGDAHYAVGVFGGDASRPQNQRFSTAYGEPAPSRTAFRTATAFDVPHPEVFVRGGYDIGPFHAAASAAYDARPVHGVDTRARFALEGHLDTKRVDLWGIGYAALADDAAGNTGEGLYGALAEAAFRVHERVEIGLRYSAVIVPERLRLDARNTADQRIAEAPEAEQEKLTDKYAGVGATEALQEATAGFAVYFFGHDLKWHSDVSWLHDSKTAGDTDAFRLRTQLQLGF